MMKSLGRKKKLTAWLVMLTFLFTCIMPNGTVLAAANDQQIENQGGTSSNSDVTISKIIAGTEKENYFDITLTVKTSKTIEELALTKKTDVVIVMDISNTMNTNNRIGNAKTAAKQFVTDFTTALGSSGRIGLVTFNRDAKNIQGFTSNATTLNNKIDQITAPADIDIKWTNIEGGLRLASNMLSSSSAPHKYIILLTDGFPTTYISSGASSTSTITGYYPSSSSGTIGNDGVFRNQDLNKWCSAGTDYSDKGATKAQNIATSIKNSGINIFSVGIDIGGQTIQGFLDKHKNATFSTVDTDNNKNSYVIGSASDANAYKNWLGNKIAGGPDLSATNDVRYSDGNNLNALKAAYSKIFEEIKTINTKAIENEWVAADPMGEDVEFQYFYDNSGRKAEGNLSGKHERNAEDTATYSSNRINWTLLKSGYTTTIEGKTTYYHYNLKYRVRLENEKAGFKENTDIVTNGTTTLKYKVNDNGNLSNEKSLEFKIPKVEGYLVDLTFTKTDSLTNSGIAGAEFTLTHNANCSVCDDVEIAAQKKTSGADGKVTFANIPSGHEYTLKETKAPNGYEAVTKAYNVKVAYDEITISNKDNTFTGTVFANKPTSTSVKVEKVWDDKDNQDGIRPESIQVQLKADTVAQGEPITLSKINNWKHTWSDLAAYKNGAKISYTVEELNVPNGYTVEKTGNTANGFVITNTHEIEKVNVEGQKSWNDNNNQDGIRPDSITVNLFANGAKVDEAIVTAANNWAYSFTNLDKYANGEEIVYTVTEDAVDGYDATINGYDIVNNHTPETINISGTKTWIDNNNQDNKRPTSIIVRLYADGVEVDNKEVTGRGNEWVYSFTDLDKYADGEEIVYTVTEDAVDGYETTINGYDIVNKHEVEKVTVEGQKTWIDNNNQDGIRPDSITVNLLADGVEVAEVEVSAADNWAYSFTNLDKYAAGKEIVYTVTEDKVAGYEATIDGYNITNEHETEKIRVEGQKSWNDNNNQDGIRPNSITVHLLADGVEVDNKEVTGSGNDWTYSFTDLDKYADGEEIVYTVTEDAVEGYETAINGYDIVNTHITETTEVTVNKVWEDNNNQDGRRPNSITVNLFANGAKVDSAAVTADANGDWSYTFTDLAKYAAGVEIVYTVTENVVEYYTATINGFIITNTYTPEITSVEGTKYWVDNNNEAGKRPGEITVNLLADGQVIDNVVVDGDAKADSWNYKFENLPKYRDAGTLIVYTVEEEPVKNYTTAINGYSITNTIEQKYFDISGTKTWIAPEGTEYPEIVIDLFRDGKAFDEVTLAPGTTEYRFENLESYDLTDGHMYQYQLAERKVDGYVPSYEMNVDGKDRIIDITNTYSDEEEYVTISGEKKWVAPEGTVLPTSVIINLYRNGEAIDEVEVTEEMNWQYSFENLAMYDENDVAYSYTVKEVPIDGYLSLVVPTANGYDITNTLYVGEAGQFSVSKAVSGGDQMVPDEDTEYSFLLKVKATVNEWNSMKVYQKSELEDARDEALEELNAANANLANAERLFRQNAVAFTTGSAYQFIMVEEVYYEEPEVTTGSAYDYTTGSAYKYTIVDNDGDILVKRSTTGSALFMNFTPAADATDAITRIIDAIKALADEFKNLNKASVFLNMLNEEQQSSTPSALKFNRTDAEDLLQAERDVREADALVAATEQAIEDFMNAEVTTPSAIKITMTPTAGSGLVPMVMELDTDSHLYDADTMTYTIDFGLLKDTGYVFTIEAADKAVIEYSISEIDWEFDNYEGTEITVNGTDKLDGRYVALRTLDKAGADTFLFNNIYEDNPEPPPYEPPTEPEPEDPPYVPPYVPPVIPDEPPVIPDEPEVPEEPVVIEEPEVPMVDIPGEIIDEEDIPLGDAPPTGDNANAVPFMMMMVLAAAGLVITRKRFN